MLVLLTFKTKSWTHSSVQSLSHVRLFVTIWTAARQASLSITNSWSPPKPMSIESIMPSSHLILCHPLLLLPSIFPSIRVFSNESARHIRWSKYWSLSFNIRPSSEHSGLISFRMDWLGLLAENLSNIALSKLFFFLLSESASTWFTHTALLWCCLFTNRSIHSLETIE